MSERKMHALKNGETVQVTSYELYRIIDEARKAGYADGRQMAFCYDPTVREQTCHMRKIDWMDRIGNKPFPRHKIVCNACGLELESDMSRGLPSFYHFCPQCGARVVDE